MPDTTPIPEAAIDDAAHLIEDRVSPISGGGEMGALMRGIDWGQTPVGPVENWPLSLKTLVRTLLDCRLPMYLAWGKEHTQFYNDAYRPILGDKHPALARSTPEVWPEIWPTIGPMWAEVWQGKSFGFDYFKLTIERFGYPEDCYFSFSYSPVPDDSGHVAGVLVTFVETTQTVMMERRLKAQAAQLSRIFEHAPVGIAVLRGPEMVFEVANPRYLELLGERDVLGLPLRQAVPELPGQGIFEILDQVYATGTEYVGTLQAQLQRGETEEPQECHFEVVYQPLPDERGQTESIVAIAFEVTELANARRDAEAASRAKDEFLAMLGHELRNPLAPILTALHLMQLRGVTGADRERAIIERQVGHMAGLVDDLLDVSRVTRGKLTLNKERLELSEAVSRAVEQCSPLLEERHHRLRIDVPQHGLMVEADPRRLAQIIANLLNNAAKYTDPEGEITLSAGSVGGEVVLTVRDSGAGMAPEILPRVFDLFYQERQDADRSQGGLGLGLAIVKNLVQLHGGRVTAASEGPGHGSEFAVWLPLAPAISPQQSEPGFVSTPSSRRTRRILVVDDNVDAAELVEVALRHSGHTTRVAHDAPEALRIAQDFLPDVAVLDIGLPGMDGYELARRLRQLPALGELRLVAVTGYGQPDDRMRSSAAGFEAHLLKPVSLPELEALCREL